MNDSRGNSVIVKEVNTTLIAKVLQTRRTATKQELSLITGLSIMTVGTILQQLEENGEVLQGEQIPSSGGRPSRLYCYNAESALLLVIQTFIKDGSDTAVVYVANAFDEIIYTKKYTFIHIEPDSLFEPLDEALRAYPAVKAIGIGLPGVIQNGKVTACDLQTLTDCDLESMLRERYGLPTVLDNDVNCVAAGRCSGMELQQGTAVVTLYFPRVCALGGGIWIGDSVYRGFRSYAGEVADMPLGIEWCKDQSLYDDKQRLSAAIAKLIATLSCVLDPQEIVLYGYFLTERHLELILNELQGGKLMTAARSLQLPDIVLSSDFEKDYRNGLLYQARSLLKPVFELRRN